ncbi:flagellar biosynthesis protein FlgA [Bosea sp. TWI1241]|uniref:flagellar biosynthesis protein FlgA n=1 Tax=Bosea sp. TWI1241 TaxID=3148904 RepID=UPI00320A3C26
MNIQNLFALRAGASDRVISAALVGAGEFGASFVSQGRRAPQIETRVICDLDLGRARKAALAGGLTDAEIRDCRSAAEAKAALDAGLVALIDDAANLEGLAVDVVIEATGDPEGAAATALAAIEAGRHLVMVTKEAECIIGPILAHRARQKGVVHTPVDGDQPSLLIGLIGWARMLGLPVVAAGKSSESDFVWDPETDTVTAWDEAVPAEGFAEIFGKAGYDPRALLEARARLPFPRTTVPDLCEMGIVCNHTGLSPDIAEMHAPIARTIELPTLFRPAAEGGLLGGTGRVDMFNCLRRRDEISFAGGVYVIAEVPDLATGKLFAGKGIPTSPDGRYVLIHNPVHLLGAEAPMSALSAALLGQSTGGAEVVPHIDLHARASRDLEPGETLEMGYRHVIGGLDPLLQPARPLGDGEPVPYYLTAGRRVLRRVPKGQILTCADIAIDEDTVLVRLRREQDEFFGTGAL